MKSKRRALHANMVIKLVLGLLVIGIVLFVCAGSLDYLNGWIFMTSLAAPMLAFVW